MSVRLLAFLVLFASAATACSPTQLLAGGFQRSDNFDVFTPTVTTTEDAQNYARAVLQRAEGRPRSIQEILSDLGNLGRTDDKYGAVASTLRYLTEESRIANPARGRYCAI